MSRAIRALVTNPFVFAHGGIALRVAMQEIDDAKGLPTRTVAVLEQSESGTFWSWRYLTGNDRAVFLDPATDRSLISFPEGVGEAILEGLSRHYHGGPAPDRQQRSDFEYERARRHDMINAYELLTQRIADLAHAALSPPAAAITTESVTVPALHFHSGIGCPGHMPYDIRTGRDEPCVARGDRRPNG